MRSKLSAGIMTSRALCTLLDVYVSQSVYLTDVVSCDMTTVVPHTVRDSFASLGALEMEGKLYLLHDSVSYYDI